MCGEGSQRRGAGSPRSVGGEERVAGMGCRRLRKCGAGRFWGQGGGSGLGGCGGGVSRRVQAGPPGVGEGFPSRERRQGAPEVTRGPKEAGAQRPPLAAGRPAEPQGWGRFWVSPAPAGGSHLRAAPEGRGRPPTVPTAGEEEGRGSPRGSPRRPQPAAPGPPPPLGPSPPPTAAAARVRPSPVAGTGAHHSDRQFSQSSPPPPQFTNQRCVEAGTCK